MTRSPELFLLCALLVGTADAVADESGTPDWLDLHADIRFRYEGIDQDNLPDRDRTRYRVRFGLDAEVYDDVRLVLALATNTDDPISRNITFGNGFRSDDIGIDLAYVEWDATNELTLIGGKMKSPIYRAGKTQLVYDNDLTPEGFAATWQGDRFFATGAAFMVNEFAVADDSHLYHVQFGATLPFGDDSKLTAGAGYFTYSDTVGYVPFYFGLPRGNTVDANDRYVYEYANTEAFAEFETRIGGLPLSLFGHWTVNNEVDDEDTAWGSGVRLGSAKQQGSWTAFWEYRDTEADAIIGAFNDSDFGGGGTDSKGHVVSGRYMLRDRISVTATAFLNEIGTFQGNEVDYQRYQLDLEFKFD